MTIVCVDVPDEQSQDFFVTLCRRHKCELWLPPEALKARLLPRPQTQLLCQSGLSQLRVNLLRRALRDHLGIKRALLELTVADIGRYFTLYQTHVPGTIWVRSLDRFGESYVTKLDLLLRDAGLGWADGR